MQLPTGSLPCQSTPPRRWAGGLGPRSCCSISPRSEPEGPVLQAGVPGAHTDVSRGPEHGGHRALLEKGGSRQKQ